MHNSEAGTADAASRTDTGAHKLANYFVGQVVGQMDKVKPARLVVLDMLNEYADVVESFAKQAATA